MADRTEEVDERGMRERFERAMRKRFAYGSTLDRLPDGSYSRDWVQWSWSLWVSAAVSERAHLTGTDFNQPARQEASGADVHESVTIPSDATSRVMTPWLLADRLLRAAIDGSKNRMSSDDWIAFMRELVAVASDISADRPSGPAGR